MENESGVGVLDAEATTNRVAPVLLVQSSHNTTVNFIIYSRKTILYLKSKVCPLESGTVNLKFSKFHILR